MRIAALVIDAGYPQEALARLDQSLGGVRHVDRFLVRNGVPGKQEGRVYTYASPVPLATVLNEMAARFLGFWKSYDGMLLLDGVDLDKQDIRKLVEFVQDEPAAGVVSPAFVKPYEMAEPVSPHLVAGTEYEARLVEYVPPRAALFRLEALREVGRFDDTLHPNLVMPDWCYRARKATWGSMVLPNAVAEACAFYQPIRFDTMTDRVDGPVATALANAERNSYPLRRVMAP